MTLETIQFTSKAGAAANVRDNGSRGHWLKFLAVAAAAAFGLVLIAAPSYAQSPDAATTAIRPFHINFPDEQLVELRQRIKATRWPEKELVPDATQGVQLATMRALAQYWATDYDWRKCEAKLNALPQFVTTIDGVDIHFIHIRSKYPNALPILITHGWPGSILELSKIIGSLTDPPAYRGRAEDAFDVIFPSMLGYGFSGKPTETGWGPEHIARAWVVLMKRLGYKHFVAQGGDWGALITDEMGVLAPPELLGIHSNMPGTVPAEINQALGAGAPPAGSFSRRKTRVRAARLFP